MEGTLREKKWKGWSGRPRSWGGGSFLKRLNVTSCTRSGTASTKSWKEHRMERKEESTVFHEVDDVVATKDTKEAVTDHHAKKANEAVIDRVVVEGKEAVTKHVVAAKEANGAVADQHVLAVKGANGDVTEHFVAAEEVKEAVLDHVVVAKEAVAKHAVVARDDVHEAPGDVGGADHEATNKAVVNETTAPTTRNDGGDLGVTSVIEDIAAIRIQALFRGHLGRRAFRALKSVVKLQALARGTYVRRQAQVAKSCMDSLARLHVRVRDRQLQLNKTRDI